MKRTFLIACLVALAGPGAAETTCYGEGSYRVCSTTTQRADGSLRVESYDTMGNTYSVESEVDTYRNGDMEVRSYDSEGNSYSVKSWSDSRGTHSRDSMGNTCSILNDGTMVGCN